MKILWFVNIALPEASSLMNMEPIPFGGWMVKASSTLAAEPGIELSVAFPQVGLNKVQILHGNRIKYFAYPPIEENYLKSPYAQWLQEILDYTKPDVIHIFGTEYVHTLAIVDFYQGRNVVISIQGLTSIYYQHYMAAVPADVQKRFTLRDFIKQDNLIQQQNKFKHRGIHEIASLQKTKHIIGRTNWDRICTSQINPQAQYHFCNETLRDEFYKHRWDIDKCERYSIFISQSSYPIKGLHVLLEAMPLISKRFPQTKIYISGHSIVKSDSWLDKLKISSYGRYIKGLIDKYHLQDKVIFTGILNEKEMCERFLKSHVFVSPSVVENESNSLSEAKIMGVPSVASYVGGVIDRINHGVDGFLYPFDASYMLAYFICEIFAHDELALGFSQNARENANLLHDPQTNLHTLIDIYKKICFQ